MSSIKLLLILQPYYSPKGIERVVLVQNKHIGQHHHSTWIKSHKHHINIQKYKYNLSEIWLESLIKTSVDALDINSLETPKIHYLPSQLRS